MGFYVMLLACVAGVIYLVVGCARAKGDRRGYAMIVAGLCLVAYAVWLGWPK